MFGPTISFPLKPETVSNNCRDRAEASSKSLSGEDSLGQECRRLRLIANSPAQQSEGLACKHAWRPILGVPGEAGTGTDDYAGRADEPGLASEDSEVIEESR